jgi:anti-sigma regulatory factor (Ser/Thr protein kinase)
MVADLSCAKKSLIRARSKVIKFAEEHGFLKEAEDVALAAQEALKNIIQHACPADYNMHLECIADGDRIIVEISDTGVGFDVSGVTNTPTPPMASHGRGIQIIEGLMDEVRITSDQEGTLVHMEKMHKPVS